MKGILLFLLFVCSLSLSAQWRYDIECAGVANEGFYLVKVSSFAKKQPDAVKQAVKNAVHGVLFKGVAGKIGGCPSQRPIINDRTTETTEVDFFKNFFSDNGDYLKYASCIGTPESIKIGREYKVSSVVSVHKDQLRKDLEQLGFVRSLSSGF